MDSGKRSLYKTISWYLVHAFTIATILFLATGNIKIAAIFASLEMLWESFAYYMHERAWAKLGKNIN
jgi:uncharacterized membrane protein